MNIISATINLDDNQTIEPIREVKKLETFWEPDSILHCHAGRFSTSGKQRFITPQCHLTPMPYHDQSSGLIINGDAYLTNYEELKKLLDVKQDIADSLLILRAYQKYGSKCVHHLSGRFLFLIWDTRKQALFAAVDRNGSIPLFYSYFPQRHFVGSNLLSTVASYCPTLTINETLFLKFAFDTYSLNETSYQEIMKLEAGHYLMLDNNQLTIKKYWNLKAYRNRRRYKTREEYYEEFRELFAKSVQRCMRVLGPITSQCSGGLDSSSVTAMAAKLLAEKNQRLYAFTALPNNLDGPSYRKGWYYHEMPRVQKLLDKYPNIVHTAYYADPKSDIYEKLNLIYPHTDQPIRNVINFDWILSNYDQVRAQGGRGLLIGTNGNITISWAGHSFRDYLVASYHDYKIWRNPSSLYDGFFNYINPAILYSPAGQKKLKRYGRSFLSHSFVLNSFFGNGTRSSIYVFQLQYGLIVLDPTDDDELLCFCDNTPNWVYISGNDVLQKRLLVREGLKELLPSEIAQNPYRGEQAADWYLHYHSHHSRWKLYANNLSDGTREIIGRYYNKEKIINFFEKHMAIVHHPNGTMVIEIVLILMRYLSACVYCETLLEN